MIKILLSGFLLQLSLSAGLINAIAITVNDEPITLVDIDNKMIELKSSQEKAITALIDEVLYKQEIAKYNIKVDQFDIDRHMEKVAANNNMSFYAFKNAVSQQQDYAKFEQQVKQQLKHQKLIGSIAANKITNASDEDLKIYYDNNPNEFSLYNKFDVIHYTSKNKKALESIKLNPMMQQSGVNVENTTLVTNEQTPQTKYVLGQTPKNNYSAIFAENGFYHLYYISDQYEKSVIGFEKVKDKIYSHIMQTRQDEFLKSYFEGLKLTAKINMLR